ncbi:MAG: hypothetical protein AAB309_03545 [Deltaproteobacteria bacterium]
MQILAVIVSSFLILASPLFALTPEKVEDKTEEELRQDYHTLQSSYSLSRVFPKNNDKKALLQGLNFSGGMIVIPGIQLEAMVPMMTLGGTLSFTNPYLGLSASLFEGLVNDFPTFVSLKTGMKLPLASDHEFVFDRTDVVIGISSLREIYHLGLSADISYIVKIDPSPVNRRYGNELASSLSAEVNTPFRLLPGIGLHYRRGGAYQDNEMKIPGQSLFVLTPFFSYHFSPDTILKTAFAIPIGRHNLRERLTVFGDYTIPGVGGNTFSLAFEKRF